jgi:response regulator NasT
MAKFVVAFRDRADAESVASLLRESGYEVIRVCTAGDEIKRAFGMIQDGILICGPRFRDRTLDQILEDLNEHVEVLCISKAEASAGIRSSRVFHLVPPVRKSLLAAWADMLIQLHYQKLPRRENSDRERSEEAKRKVMKELNLTQAEAHRHLQRLSMRLGIRMPQVAEVILKDGTE